MSDRLKIIPISLKNHLISLKNPVISSEVATKPLQTRSLNRKCTFCVLSYYINFLGFFSLVLYSSTTMTLQEIIFSFAVSPLFKMALCDSNREEYELITYKLSVYYYKDL